LVKGAQEVEKTVVVVGEMEAGG
jgi:hypothetical protein